MSGMLRFAPDGVRLLLPDGTVIDPNTITPDEARALWRAHVDAGASAMDAQIELSKASSAYSDAFSTGTAIMGLGEHPSGQLEALLTSAAELSEEMTRAAYDRLLSARANLTHTLALDALARRALR